MTGEAEGAQAADRITVLVHLTTPSAETSTVKTRKRSRDDVPADGGGLETWLQDLVDGETTARRLRKRLEDEAGERPEADCAVCQSTATGKVYFGLDDHLHGRISA